MMGPCDVKGSTHPLPVLGFCEKYDAIAFDSLPRYSNIHLFPLKNLSMLEPCD